MPKGIWNSTPLNRSKSCSVKAPGSNTKRLGTVEPPFGNMRHHKGMDRFTLRGRRKVDGQCKLYALADNIEKLANYGM